MPASVMMFFVKRSRRSRSAEDTSSNIGLTQAAESANLPSASMTAYLTVSEPSLSNAISAGRAAGSAMSPSASMTVKTTHSLSSKRPSNCGTASRARKRPNPSAAERRTFGSRSCRVAMRGGIARSSPSLPKVSTTNLRIFASSWLRSGSRISSPALPVCSSTSRARFRVPTSSLSRATSEETTRGPPMRIKAAAAASCTPGFSSLRPSMRGLTAWD